MNQFSSLKLIVMFLVAFSLASLAGPMSASLHLPAVQLANAVSEPCQTTGSSGACSQFWYPAGPEMNVLNDTVFPGGLSEYASLFSVSPGVDFTDSPCSLILCAKATASPGLYITAPVPAGHFAYLQCQPPSPCSSANSWVRAINDATVGLPNYFTWLNAWNPAAAVPGTIRQGFRQDTTSVNPYIASSRWDGYVVRSVYDSLYAINPLNSSQTINWMTEKTDQLSNSSLIYKGGLTGAPAHTLTTYRFTLRPDLFFQDGRPVTSYDVAFSYLSMVGSGAFLGTGASTMTGITILGPQQFDIGVNSLGPFVLPNLASIPIVSGRYWTNAGTSPWDTAVSACTTSVCEDVQYTLSGATVNCAGTCTSFSASKMTINPSDTSATFDPITAHSFVGSGPWQCGVVTSSGSGSCTTSGSYTLSRFGNGLAPASSMSGIYFRSSGDLALYLWSEQNNVNPLLAFEAVASCYQAPVNLAGPCGHFQQGIGNPGTGTPVGASQVSVSMRFYNLNWIEPYNWASNPPTGIGAMPPVLYEGSVTLNPASVVGCPNGYDC